MIRRDDHGLRVLECDRCAATLHLAADGDAFDIGRAVSADGWTFGAVDSCRECGPPDPAPVRRRRTAA